jgi:Kef-type K+ transport system membrane component KefB
MLDDIVEILVLINVILFVGGSKHGHFDIALIVFSLFGLFILTFGLTWLKSQREKFNVLKIESLFLFVVAVLFLFLGIGEYAEATALGAILAGVGVKTFIPDDRLKLIKSEVRAVCYGLFAPIFFLWAGLSMDIAYLATYPFLILLVIVTSSGSKYLGAYIVGRKELGLRQSILLGTGLSVRFSTSIVVVKILFDNDIIRNDLYSVIIASSIVFTFVVPLLFSVLLNKWDIRDEIIKNN